MDQEERYGQEGRGNGPGEGEVWTQEGEVWTEEGRGMAGRGEVMERVVEEGNDQEGGERYGTRGGEEVWDQEGEVWDQEEEVWDAGGRGMAREGEREGYNQGGRGYVGRERYGPLEGRGMTRRERYGQGGRVWEGPGGGRGMYPGGRRMDQEGEVWTGGEVTMEGDVWTRRERGMDSGGRYGNRDGKGEV
ncbi:hypothetical protein WMY93_000422 [Mugilogobius chulae]|uniref:Uncharacterized protein n=1 Tax=Mugilogobius chulae TaxID=88201 RepID=A0AAW0PZ90_9GOBI